MTIKCGNCGAELQDGAQFCKQCGASVAQIQPVDEKSYIEYLIVGILGSAFVPLVGIAIGIWLYTRKTPASKRNGLIVIAAAIISWIFWFIFS